METDFCRDWKFYRGDLPPRDSTDGWGGAKARAYSFGAAAEALDDSSWRTVSLPHDFVAEGDYTQKRSDSSMLDIPEMESINSRHFAGGSLEGGVGWYRKTFELPDAPDKRVYIYFGGVYRNSDVYLNEYFVGNHKDGYTEFCYDITDFVNFGGKNVLAVRVDASGREGWWYEGGGIYRSVRLEIRNSVHVAPRGVFAAPSVNSENGMAEIKIKTELVNRRTEAAEIMLESVISDADGSVILSLTREAAVGAWDNAEFEQTGHINSPHLWDLDNPYLYTLKTNVYENGKLLDSRETDFGIRDIRFSADSGFYLNGKSVRVKGLCCHQDHAGVGIAVPKSVWEYRIAQMKGMGMNAYRSAHHQPSEELLEICDREGILVLAETRRMSGCGEDLRALETLVKVGRNHPSVFLWGIGNEEIFSQDRAECERTTLTMKMTVKKLDDTRPVTAAVVCWNGKERFDTAESYIHVTKNLDVMGFNYCKTAWDDYHARMSEQPIIITEETTSGSTRGCCSTDESRGLYYIMDSENEKKCKSGKKALRAAENTGEATWKYFAERPYLNGIFLWTGMDYRGEPTPLAYPAVYSQFGIFDYCGFPKDIYYYYKSWWSGEDVLHVFPHWNHRGREGEPLTVHCFSNFDEVELFVNGRSLGKKKTEKNWYLTWENVVYEPGELAVKGFRNGKEAASRTVKTTGAAEKIALTPYRSEVAAGDTVIVNVSALDGDGNAVPTADNQIRFTAEGSGEFLGTGNGNPGSHESDKLPVRRLFNGLCQLLVSALETGEIKITAESDGLKSAVCTVTVK